MALIKKKSSRGADIPTGSMADIAFLLLLFFLVATVIDVDTGIGLTLPEYIPEEQRDFVPLSKDRLAALLINENGDVLLNGEVVQIPLIKDKLMEKIRGKISEPKNKKLVVSLKTDRNTVYNLYIQALDQVKGAYFQVWEDYARQTFGKSVEELDEEQNKQMKDNIPMIISIAEPEKVK